MCLSFGQNQISDANRQLTIPPAFLETTLPNNLMNINDRQKVKSTLECRPPAGGIAHNSGILLYPKYNLDPKIQNYIFLWQDVAHTKKFL